MTTAGYKLNDQERAHLLGFYNLPGFQILQRMCEAEISQMQLDLVNIKASDTKEVLAAHKLAKAAAMFYQRLIDRINSEIVAFQTQKEQESKPVLPDETEKNLQY